MDRNRFLTTVVPRVKQVEIPGETEKMSVRGLTGTEVIEISKKFARMDYADFPMLIYSVIDSNGQPLFTEADLPALAALPMERTYPLLAAVKELSGMTSEAPKASGATS
jgi:hypothetical protein